MYVSVRTRTTAEREASQLLLGRSKLLQQPVNSMIPLIVFSMHSLAFLRTSAFRAQYIMDSTTPGSGFHLYTTLAAYTRLGDANLLLQAGSKGTAYLPAHLNFLSIYSPILCDTITASTKAVDPVSGLDIFPLEGDCIVDWLQALTAMYMHTEGASDEEQWGAMLVSLRCVSFS